MRRLLTWLWEGTLAEEASWRLLIGEGLRGEPAARVEAAQLVALLEPALQGWLRTVAPAFDDRAPALAGLMRSVLLSLALEHLALGPDDDAGGGPDRRAGGGARASTEPARRSHAQW